MGSDICLSAQWCHNMLQAVYDASPVVRAEVAVGLARLAVSHSLLFQVSAPRRTFLHGQCLSDITCVIISRDR